VREYFEQNGEIKPGKKVNFFFLFPLKKLINKKQATWGGKGYWLYGGKEFIR
jgi:hypothetical protein